MGSEDELDELIEEISGWRPLENWERTIEQERAEFKAALQAYINVDGKRFQVGKFDNEDEAAWMRDQWALALHGEYASLNFDYA